MKIKVRKTWFFGIISSLVPVFFLAAACGEKQNLGDKTPQTNGDDKNSENKVGSEKAPGKIDDQKTSSSSTTQSLNSIPFLEEQKNTLEIQTIKLINKEKKQTDDIAKVESATKEIEEKESEINKKIEELNNNSTLTENQIDHQEEKVKLEKEKQEIEKQKKDQEEKLLKEREKLMQIQEEKRKNELEKQEVALKANRQILEEKKQLDAVLSKIPDALEIAEYEKKRSNNVATVLYHFKQNSPTFHYENFIKKIENFDDNKNTITFNFNNVKTVDNNRETNERRLENVELSVSKKDSPVKLTKNVTLFWNLEDAQKIEETNAELYQKTLSPIFSKISPSILAYALANSNKETVFNSPLFANFNAAFSQVSLSVGLKDEFLGIKSVVDPQKWSFKIISATPDDENGMLKIKAQMTKSEEQTNEINNAQEFTFNDLKKSNDSDFDFEVDQHKVWPQIREKKILKEEGQDQELTELQKGQIAKIIFESLYFKIKNSDADVLLKEFLVKDHIKNNSFFPYPQIISLKWAEMISNEGYKKVNLELKDKKLIYSFDLEYANLANNSTLTSQDDSLQFADFKKKKIKGEIPLDHFLK
ncbi:mycoides cluster lipoprotein, LppA/P72 family [Mesomycoplasma dispar]|uniref:Mycoides cluster lipoprotein, LppA/P72 family n=1 Tax=Mesomycoplasma dispar TaxID=86660 RepID=A0AAJ5NLH9_9BACT|nr:hypothetical protein [Mesomycoplasma dispar]AJR12252.1 hypothetical protein MDIS_02385 [Mesomycoplasma dispar]VEU61910.1 mycoides cluster lipoprotein, LppA/P72 family [Mesomycoplasma dispar]